TVEFLLLDPLPDLVPRARRLHESEPVPRRALLRIGEDLDGVSVAQLLGQGRDAAVHLGARAAEADLGVDRKGKVDSGRAARQLLYIALRGEDENLILEEVDLEELHEFLWLSRLLLPLE